jgi:hypothetical protein
LFPWRSKKRLLAKHSSSHPGDGNSWEQSGEQMRKAWESAEQFRLLESYTH